MITGLAAATHTLFSLTHRTELTTDFLPKKPAIQPSVSVFYRA
jgi:hypothetical protein